MNLTAQQNGPAPPFSPPSQQLQNGQQLQYVSPIPQFVPPQEIPAAISRLRANSVIRVENSDSTSSSLSSPFLFNCFQCCESNKFRSIFQALLLGQLMSLCLCGTGVSSQLLAERKFNAPAAQSLLNYFFLAFIYCVILVFRSESRNFTAVLQERGWKYFLLAVVDVEANYLIVYAYQFTNLTSIQLLNCFTIPVVMLLSWCFLSVRYVVSHIIGVAICLLGVALIIYADAAARDGLDGGSNRLLGDMLCLAATILYGTANVSEEFLVKQNDRVEYLGMVGLFGCVISGVQLTILEGQSLSTFQWSAFTIGIYLLFTLCMFVFYSLVTVVMQRSSALMFNLSVLTASFYSLVVGVFLFHNSFQILYPFSFLAVLVGSSIYSYKKTETDHGHRCAFVKYCCGDCRFRSAYTVQDVQAENSTSSPPRELHSEIHSSSISSSF